MKELVTPDLQYSCDLIVTLALQRAEDVAPKLLPDIEAAKHLVKAAPKLLAACEAVLMRCQLYGAADRVREQLSNAIAAANPR